MRKSLMSEIEKICNTFFSGSIDYDGLVELAGIAMNIHAKFNEDILTTLTQKLTDSQLSLISSDHIKKMCPLRGVMMMVDELLLNWVTAYYQTAHTQLKSQLEHDTWIAADLEDKVADHLEFITYLGKPHDEYDSFYVVKKQIVVGGSHYFLSQPFVGLVAAVYSFCTMIYQKKVASFHLSVKMIELVMVAYIVTSFMYRT